MTAPGAMPQATPSRMRPHGGARPWHRAAAAAVLACGMLWPAGAVRAAPPPSPSPPPLTLALADLPAFAPALIAEAEG